MPGITRIQQNSVYIRFLRSYRFIQSVHLTPTCEFPWFCQSAGHCTWVWGERFRREFSPHSCRSRVFHGVWRPKPVQESATRSLQKGNTVVEQSADVAEPDHICGNADTFGGDDVGFLALSFLNGKWYFEKCVTLRYIEKILIIRDLKQKPLSNALKSFHQTHASSQSWFFPGHFPGTSCSKDSGSANGSRIKILGTSQQ